MKQFKQYTAYFIMLIICLLTQVQVKAQSSGSIVVGGDFDKFYPVVWTDGNWWGHKMTTLYIGRSSVHEDSQWRGAVMSQFNFHTTNWGHQSNFIEGFVRYSKVPFIAGWKDATANNSIYKIIIWLRGGGTTYHYSTADGVAVDPVVYDGVANSLPYNEMNGPAHTYRTTIDSYVNSNGWFFPSDVSVQENLNVAGKIGIETTTPTNKLQIGINPAGFGGNDLVVSNSNGSFAIHNETSETYMVTNARNLSMGANGINALFIKADGKIGIGTKNPQSQLAVNGELYAKKVKVTQSGWSDFVFEKDYVLKPLSEVEAFIKQNKHLPEVPSADEVAKNDLDLGEMNKILLQKIEEHTLYLIAIQKENMELRKENNDQQTMIESLSKRIVKLEESERR